MNRYIEETAEGLRGEVDRIESIARNDIRLSKNVRNRLFDLAAELEHQADLLAEAEAGEIRAEGAECVVCGEHAELVGPLGSSILVYSCEHCGSDTLIDGRE